MSHKVHPLGFRLGINVNWKSRWFDLKNFSAKLGEDIAIREYVTKKLRGAGLEKVEIERTANKVSVIIHSSRPGLIIGRAGSGAEDLKKALDRVLRNAYRPASPKFQRGDQAGKAKGKNQRKFPELRLDIREVRNPETFASLIGLNIAEQLEKRMPFRRVIKRTIERVMANKTVKGVKIMLGGRLGGSEMARREWMQEGVMPRSSLRSDIDFSIQEAYTTYGVIGIKVWIYKGQKSA